MIHGSNIFTQKHMNEVKLGNIPILFAILFMNMILIQRRCCLSWTKPTRVGSEHGIYNNRNLFNPLKPELNSICYLLALLAHHFLHVSRMRVKSLTFRRLMSYIYMEHPFLMFLDHTQRRSTVGRTPLDE